MNVPGFQAKWHGSTLKERSAAQEHFLDLCRVPGMPTPAQPDKTGAFYTFENGATKTKGGQGFADVWWDGRFAWEYKGRRADLKAAYQQLLQYREDLGNPPLLVVCNLDRFEMHTNFTGTKKVIHAFAVADLDQRETLDMLQTVFSDPEALRPGQTVGDVAVEAAARFATLAAGLQVRGVDPHKALHLLVRLLFCLFSEDVGLLVRSIFTNLGSGDGDCLRVDDGAGADRCRGDLPVRQGRRVFRLRDQPGLGGRERVGLLLVFGVGVMAPICPVGDRPIGTHEDTDGHCRDAPRRWVDPWAGQSHLNGFAPAAAVQPLVSRPHASPVH